MIWVVALIFKEVVFLPWPAEWEYTEILKDSHSIGYCSMGLQLRDKKVDFNVYNIALVRVINKQTNKSKRFMELVRHVVLGFMKNNVVFKAKHISSVDYKKADSISRKEWRRFQELVPTARGLPEKLPREVVSYIYSCK